MSRLGKGRAGFQAGSLLAALASGLACGPGPSGPSRPPFMPGPSWLQWQEVPWAGGSPGWAPGLQVDSQQSPGLWAELAWEDTGLRAEQSLSENR